MPTGNRFAISRGAASRLYRKLPYCFCKGRVDPREYDFDLEELSENRYDEKRLGTTEFQVSVYDFDGNEYVLDKPVEVSAHFGAVYYLVLDGTFEEGFTVKIK